MKTRNNHPVTSVRDFAQSPVMLTSQPLSYNLKIRHVGDCADPDPVTRYKCNLSVSRLDMLMTSLNTERCPLHSDCLKSTHAHVA